MLTTSRVMSMLTLFVLALFGVSGLIGGLLPRQHHVESTVFLHEPPEEVWQMISDVPASALWRENVVKVQRLPDHAGHPLWRTVTDGGDWDIEMRDAHAPLQLTLASVDSTRGFGDAWTLVLTPQANGTLLRICEDGYVDHPVFRFFFQVADGFHRQQRHFLLDLGHAFGEQVHPRAV